MSLHTACMSIDPIKPRWRGVLHQYAIGFAVVAGVWLVSMADAPRARLGAGIYAVSLAVLFSVSAAYHRVTWSAAARARMRRADHASIFVLIAGTYTPLVLLGLPAPLSDRLFLLVWCGAFIGIAQSMFWLTAPKAVTAVLAIALGWSVLPWWREAYQALPASTLVLLFVGGVFYTVGGICYALKRPKLWPTEFGYHELFHAFTIFAAVPHFCAVRMIVQRATQP